MRNSGRKDEASEEEAGEEEAGEVEAGEEEAGEEEAGEVEAGEVEAGEEEAGEVEAGEVEAGEVEAGEVEAGDEEKGRCGTRAIGRARGVVVTTDGQPRNGADDRMRACPLLTTPARARALYFGRARLGGEAEEADGRV